MPFCLGCYALKMAIPVSASCFPAFALERRVYLLAVDIRLNLSPALAKYGTKPEQT